MVLQFLLILVFWFSFQAYINGTIEPTKAFVFNKDILEVNTQITESDITEVLIPAKAISNGFATDINEVIGKYVTSKVYTGQYVYSAQLADIENIDIFESTDLTSLRKISLPISYVEGLAGNIKRGDKVDLVFSGEGTKSGSTGSEEKFIYSKLFIQDVLVYSVATGDGFKFVDHSNFLVSDVPENGQEIDVQSNSDELEVITLAVTPEQVEEIVARATAGTVKVVGRFAESENRQTLGYILGDYEKVFTGQANAETGRTEISEK